MTKRDRILFGAAVGILVLCEIAGRLFRSDALWFPMAETILTRLIGAAVFVVLICRMGYGVLGSPDLRRHRAVPLLSLLVAVNNFPWIGLFTGRARIDASVGTILLFACECIAVGLFEELAFRGFLLPYCLMLTRGRRHAVLLAAVLSSSVFALVHLVNLFSGASPGAVVMQIGYSFLIGGMCACVLLASRSVWPCAAIHAVYNFCGTVVPRLGEGNGWDPVTITLTVLLGIFTASVLLRFLWKTDERETDFLFTPSQTN
ncbi:MAG: CPBP family intramembrane metalloprotease [Clostridia bacterium]|nr:CPBP family intramembrane metalloprotease [Clostridia bacterium]